MRAALVNGQKAPPPNSHPLVSQERTWNFWIGPWKPLRMYWPWIIKSLISYREEKNPRSLVNDWRKFKTKAPLQARSGSSRTIPSFSASFSFLLPSTFLPRTRYHADNTAITFLLRAPRFKKISCNEEQKLGRRWLCMKQWVVLPWLCVDVFWKAPKALLSKSFFTEATPEDLTDLEIWNED